MIRITLVAAGLLLGTAGAYAQTVPASQSGAASAARSLGATASPGDAYGNVRPAPRYDVETTGTIVRRPDHQRVMGLPVPDSD